MIATRKYHTYNGNMQEADRHKRIGDMFANSSNPRLNIAKQYYATAESLYSDAATIASLYGEKELKQTALNKMYGCIDLIKACNRQLGTITLK